MNERANKLMNNNPETQITLNERNYCHSQDRFVDRRHYWHSSAAGRNCTLALLD